MTTLFNSEERIERIEEAFLRSKKKQKKIARRLVGKGTIDISAASSMHLFDASEHWVASLGAQAAALATHYPSIIGPQSPLITAFLKKIKALHPFNIQAEEIAIFPGVYGSYRTVIGLNASPVIIVPASMHQIHKACFAYYGKRIIEVPVDANGLLDLLSLAQTCAAYRNQQPYIFITHNRGPQLTAQYIRRITSILEKNNLYAIYDADTIATFHDEKPQWPHFMYRRFRERSIILINLTKEIGAPGLRIGFGIGSRQLINQVKRAQTIGLEMISPVTAKIAELILKRSNFQKSGKELAVRMSFLCSQFKKLAWPASSPATGVNLFLPTPPSFQGRAFPSADLFCFYVLKQADIQLRPGVIYGEETNKEQFRVVACQPITVMKKVFARLKEQKISYTMPFPAHLETEYAALLKSVKS
jgi:aspartate/methionine/tyrosine aminotransferase